MRFILSILSLFLITSTYAQGDYVRSIDKKNKSVVYQGPISFGDLNREPSFSWFGLGVQAYTPDSASIRFLRDNLGNYRMIILLGTWCSDSQDIIPKLYKTLLLAKYPMSQITMFGVDRKKTTLKQEHMFYHLESVPTIILMKEDKEIARIVESLNKTIEEDLVALIKKDLP